MSGEKFSALILAAGRSSRMGDFKPLLPLGETTVIGRAVEAFREAGVDDIIVVAGFEAERLIRVLRKINVGWAVNQDYDQGMFSSVRTGVQALGDSCRAFFVLPADHPLVRPSTISALMNAHCSSGKSRLVCRPSFMGRRGHPPLLSAGFVDDINGFRDAGGLRELLSLHEEETLIVDCDDPGILVDIDSQEDYRAAVKKLAGAGSNRPPDKA